MNSFLFSLMRQYYQRVGTSEKDERVRACFGLSVLGCIDMKKLTFFSVVWMILCAFIMAKFVLDSCGIVHMGALEGFAVDSQENLYLGYAGDRGSIEVYHDGELIREIKPPTNKGFFFMIEDDKLIIGREASKKVGVYDLYGNSLDESELGYDYDTVKRTVAKTKVIEQNGKYFTLNKYLGFKPFEIMCDGVVIYRMSTLAYILNGPPFMFYAVFAAMCALVLIPMLATDEKVRSLFR